MSSAAVQFANVPRVLFQMLCDRGFPAENVVAVADPGVSIQQAFQKALAACEELGTSKKKSVSQGFVFMRATKRVEDDPTANSTECQVMLVPGKLGVEVLRATSPLKNTAEEGRSVSLLVITLGKITAPCKKHLQSPEVMSWVSAFEISEVIQDKTRHKLNPTFRKLASSEVEQLKLVFEVTKFPRILMTDPVAKHFGLKPLDVLEITGSDSSTCGCGLRYRICMWPNT